MNNNNSHNNMEHEEIMSDTDTFNENLMFYDP